MDEVIENQYVEMRNSGYYLRSARVSLDSIVYAFQRGESPETIRQDFPALTLEQVYGAIAYYLGHQGEVDANIREGEQEIARTIPPLSEDAPELYSKLMRAREQLGVRPR